MSRDLTAGVASAVADSNVRVILLVSLDFSSGVARYCSAPFDVSWDGYTWVGVGELGSVQAIEETGNVEAKGINLTLSGVDTANIALALGDVYQGRDCKIYAAFLDSGHSIIADPKMIFLGRMDTMDVEVGQTATITVMAESRLADLERARVRRYNDADQQAEHPGDTFFKYVDQMVEKTIVWGN